jgi:hypothetical protein
LSGCNSKPTQKWWQICSTALSFIRKKVTSYKIYTLVLNLSFYHFQPKNWVSLAYWITFHKRVYFEKVTHMCHVDRKSRLNFEFHATICYFSIGCFEIWPRISRILMKKKWVDVSKQTLLLRIKKGLRFLGQHFGILTTVLNPKTRNESFQLVLFIKIDFNDVNSVERRAMLLTHPAELDLKSNPPTKLKVYRT